MPKKKEADQKQSDTMSEVQFNRAITTQPAYTVRYENHQGRRHIVVPVVLMVEGVHCGSHGPVFHTESELSRYPASWNGIPVVINHPEVDGQPVSANVPQVVDSEVIGRVYNVHYDGKLKGEVWLDEALVQSRQQGLSEHLAAGKPMDVSVGAFTDDEPAQGEWNGEVYTSISHNYRPDHLALLPQSRGACSWADGCGLRVNELVINQTDGGCEMDKALWNAFLTAGFRVTPVKEGEFQTNQVGYREILNLIQRKLDVMDNDVRMHFLEELFDNGTFIYRISFNGERSNQPSPQYYKRSYTMTDEGQVEFGDDVIPVRRQVDYVDVPQGNGEQEFVRTKGEKKMGTNAEKKPCGCPDKVNDILAMEHFTDEDRSWLEKLDDSGLDRIIAVHAEMVKKEEPKDPRAPEVNADKSKAPEKEEPIQMNEQEFLAKLPDDLRHQMEYGMKLYKEHRTELKQGIMNNTDVYAEADLDGMSDEGLEKLAKVVQPKGDYSIGGASVQRNTQGEEVLLPPGVKATK